MKPSNVILPPVEVVTHPKNKNLMLVPGSISLPYYERTLSVGIHSRDLFYYHMISGLNAIIQKTAQKNGADIIVIDTSPSISILNMLIIMYSDYFITPIQGDFFSYCAIETLYNIIDNWVSERNDIINVFNPRIRPKNPPKFLGVVFQMFPLTGRESYKYTDTIKEFIKTKLAPKLRKYSMIGRSMYFFGPVPNFGKFVPMAQKKGVPIIALKDKEHEEELGELMKPLNIFVKKIHDIVFA